MIVRSLVWVGLLALMVGVRAQEPARGAVSGTVTTLEGDPVEGAQVTARRVAAEGTVSTGMRVTDDRGEFRLYGLTPGMYELQVLAGVNTIVGEGATHGWSYPVGEREPTLVRVEAGATVAGKDFVVPAARSQGESANGLVVAGAVDELFGGSAVAGALVEIKKGPVWLRARTGQDGRFRFAGVPPGEYSVHAWKAGYVWDVPETMLARVGKRSVSVKEGAPADDVKVMLVRDWVMEGHVMAEGAFVAHAMVSAHTLSGTQGSELKRLATAFTDDRGEFRLYGLMPGRYYVTAEMGADEAKEREPVPTFFPGAVRFGDAVAVRVGADGVPVSVDLEMMVAKKRTVRGAVSMPQGAKAIQVRLRPVGVALFGEKHAEVDGKSGAFVVRDTWPGEYEVVATAQVGGARWSEVVPVNLRFGDEEDVRLTLEPLLRIGGVVRVDGQPFGAGGALVQISETGASGRVAAHAATLPEGVFTLEDVQPGSYRLTVSGVKGACYVKSVTVGASAANVEQVPLIDGGRRLHVLLGTDCGGIRGQVVDADGNAVRGRRVVVVESGRSGRLWKEISDAQGQFVFEGIEPGSYRIYELSDEMEEHEVPAFGGQNVEVKVGEVVGVRLKD